MGDLVEKVDLRKGKRKKKKSQVRPKINTILLMQRGLLNRLKK